MSVLQPRAVQKPFFDSCWSTDFLIVYSLSNSEMEAMSCNIIVTKLVWLSNTIGKSAEQQTAVLSKLQFLLLMQVLRKLFGSISSDKTYNHRMVWQSTRREHTQRKDRSILGVLLLADAHGRCLFHALPFDGQLWCQIELYLIKQLHFTSCWFDTFKCCHTHRPTSEKLLAGIIST